MTLPSKETKLASLLSTITKSMVKNMAAILLALGKILYEVSKNIREEIPVIAEQVNDQVVLKVVGESYYKWNSTPSFYPTVVFIFHEINGTNRPKKSQIKTRLSVRMEDFNDQVVEQLREKAQPLANLRYNHGVVRGNYVSSDKRFKTTVYGRGNDEIKDLYKRIMPVIGERFEPNNLSYTSHQLIDASWAKEGLYHQENQVFSWDSNPITMITT